MKFVLENYNRNTPDKDLIDDLKYVANLLKKDKVTIDEYNENGNFHSTTLTRRFGSWFKCLELAGLKRTRSKLNITNVELFENLMDVWTKLGRQPKYNEMYKPLSKYSSGTYENRFGSWRNALENFIRYVNEEEIVIEPGLIKMETANVHKTQRNINIRMRFMVLRRDNFKCKICGKSPATDSKIVLHVDHIIACAKGVETVILNLQTLCSEALEFKGEENIDLHFDKISTDVIDEESQKKLYEILSWYKKEHRLWFDWLELK